MRTEIDFFSYHGIFFEECKLTFENECSISVQLRVHDLGHIMFFLFF